MGAYNPRITNYGSWKTASTVTSPRLGFDGMLEKGAEARAVTSEIKEEGGHYRRRRKRARVKQGGK